MFVLHNWGRKYHFHSIVWKTELKQYDIFCIYFFFSLATNTLSSYIFLMNVTGYVIHSWMCANHVIKDLPCPVLKISTLRTEKIRQLNGCSPLSALNQRLQQWKCQSFQFCSMNKIRWTIPLHTHIETPTFLNSYHRNNPPSRVICFTAGSEMKGNLNLSFCTFWQSSNNRRCEIKVTSAGKGQHEVQLHSSKANFWSASERECWNRFEKNKK